MQIYVNVCYFVLCLGTVDKPLGRALDLRRNWPQIAARTSCLSWETDVSVDFMEGQLCAFCNQTVLSQSLLQTLTVIRVIKVDFFTFDDRFVKIEFWSMIVLTIKPNSMHKMRCWKPSLAEQCGCDCDFQWWNGPAVLPEVQWAGSAAWGTLAEQCGCDCYFQWWNGPAVLPEVLYVVKWAGSAAWGTFCGEMGRQCCLRYFLWWNGPTVLPEVLSHAAASWQT